MTHREVLMAVTVEHSSKCVLTVVEVTVNEKGTAETSKIVFSRLCCIREIYNARYIPDDKTTNKVKRAYSRRNKTSFVHIQYPENRSELKLLGIKAIRAVWKIEKASASYSMVFSIDFLIFSVVGRVSKTFTKSKSTSSSLT